MLTNPALSHLMNNGASQNILQNLPKLLTSHSPTQPLLNAMNQAPLITSQSQMMHNSSTSPHNTSPHR